jgi:hypothetical protein
MPASPHPTGPPASVVLAPESDVPPELPLLEDDELPPLEPPLPLLLDEPPPLLDPPPLLLDVPPAPELVELPLPEPLAPPPAPELPSPPSSPLPDDPTLDPECPEHAAMTPIATTPLASQRTRPAIPSFTSPTMRGFARGCQRNSSARFRIPFQLLDDSSAEPVCR